MVEKISQRIKEQPLPSLVAFEILRTIEDPDHSLKDVVRLVETDASLTSEVLKMANSAAYYRGQPVTTVNRAVLLMGEMMVVGIAICVSTSIVYQKPLQGYESEAGEMWEHSLRAAIASRELAKFTNGKVNAGLAFTAGLLHDIGKSVISEFLVGNAREMTELCENREAEDYLEAERRACGTDHTEVGYSLAKHWGLPEALCLGIRDHHHPQNTVDQHKVLVYLVHLGDIMSMLGGCGTGSDSLAYTIDNSYEKYVPIAKNQIDSVLLRVEEHFVELKETLMSNGKG
ncbi:MAG: HDOD domain-containing protein [bacterium]